MMLMMLLLSNGDRLKRCRKSWHVCLFFWVWLVGKNAFWGNEKKTTTSAFKKGSFLFLKVQPSSKPNDFVGVVIRVNV